MNRLHSIHIQSNFFFQLNQKKKKNSLEWCGRDFFLFCFVSVTNHRSRSMDQQWIILDNSKMNTIECNDPLIFLLPPPSLSLSLSLLPFLCGSKKKTMKRVEREKKTNKSNRFVFEMWFVFPFSLNLVLEKKIRFFYNYWINIVFDWLW